MVDQKFICVAFILLFATGLVVSYPGEKTPAPVIATAEADATATTNSTGGPPFQNVIVAPHNCPKGQKMAADGVCREVLDDDMENKE